MRYMVEVGVPEDFIEIFEEMEGTGNRVDDLEKADVLLCLSPCSKMRRGLIRIVFEEGKIIVDKNSIKVGEFVAHKQAAHPIWAFVKSMADGKASIISRGWARKIVSGILQGMIALMEVEDEDGYSHSQRVAKLAVEFGKHLGMDDDDLEELREHAMLHDVGKIGIEQLMLYSPTRIRVFEKLPQDHTILGSVYLSSIELLWDVIPTVRYHHERWDGKGYPDGLKGEEIPLFARIVAICDLYDNLTHFVTSEWDSSIKSPEEALEIIEEEAGRALDPRLAREFVKMMRKGMEVGKDKEG